MSDIHVSNFISFTDWNIIGFKMRICPLKAVSDIKGQLALLLLSLMIIKIWAQPKHMKVSKTFILHN